VEHQPEPRAPLEPHAVADPADPAARGSVTGPGAPGRGTAVRRPAELIVVIVLTYLSALGSVLLGIVVIFARYDEDVIADGFVTLITIFGAALVMLGLLIAAVAGGIARGDRTARWSLTVLLGIQVVLHLGSLALNPEDLWSQVFSAAIALASGIVLWTGRTARWFAHRAVAGTSGGTTAHPRAR